MGPLKDIRLSWPAFSLLAMISVAATAFILAGGGGRSPAESAALAALRDPPRVAAAAKTGSGASGGSGSTNSGAGGGGSSQGGLGGGTSPDSTSDTTTTSSSQSNTSTPTKTTTTKKHHKQSPPPDAGLPKVKHVFEIALSTPSYSAAFGQHSEATYLQSLVKRGALLTNYESFGHSSELADYVAGISGQAPNSDTAKGCPVYKSFSASAAANAKGVVSGNGCIYPDTALTLADQTGIAGETWGAYIQSMGAKTSCQYPDPGASENKGITGTEPGYSLDHNPFIYFESLLEEGACDSSDLDLSLLPKALGKVKTTPNFTYIAPNECADGDPVTAASDGGIGTTTSSTTTTTSTSTTTAPEVGCPAGDTSGIVAEDEFLQTWVPKILKSPGYKQDGVLVIAFAASGDKATGKMVRTGALVISKHTGHGLKVGGDYGPYSLLRSLEDMLDYQPLANAASAGSFAKRVL